MSSLKSRVLVAVVGVPVLLWVVLAAPRVVIEYMLVLLAGIGGAELQQCVSGKQKGELVTADGNYVMDCPFGERSGCRQRTTVM